MYNNTYSRISSLQFGTMSPEEIRDSSVTEITKYQSFKSDGKPIPQGLFDAKMSPTDKSERCETDLLPIDLTPGSKLVISGNSRIADIFSTNNGPFELNKEMASQRSFFYL